MPTVSARLRARMRAFVDAWWLDLLGLACVLCFGATVYLWLGPASTWAYAGFVLLVVWYVVTKARAGDQIDEP
jgi:hypothetical protein